MKQFTSFVVSVLLLVFLSACSDDHTTDPGPETNPDTEKLQKSIVGKWVVESRSGRTMAQTAFIEFLSDSTFVLYNVTDTLVQGKFNATSGTDVSLEKFGSLSEIRFAQNKISFKLTYANNILTISANKVDAVESSDRTNKLSGSWSLTADENGVDFFNENNDWGKMVVKITFFFSPSGTFIGQVYAADGLILSETRNWKWHSDKADRFVFWEDGAVVNEQKDYVIIRQLTESILKTQEYHPDQDGVLQPSNLVFKK